MVDEFAFAIEKMESEDSAQSKLYYFSGVFGVMNRVMNFEFDPLLVHAHMIIRGTYEAFLGRVKAQQAGELSVLLFEGQFEDLIDRVKQLKDRIEKDKEFFDVLTKFALLAYSTTGNGHYLLQRGILKP